MKNGKTYRMILRHIACLLAVTFMAVQMLTQLLPYRNVDAACDGRIACTASGSYFAVSPYGRLVAWGSNEPVPMMSYDSVFFPTPFFARRTMMKNVKEVCATGRSVFALDQDGTLWRWDDTHGSGGYLSLKQPFTGSPEKIMEQVVDFDQDGAFSNNFALVTTDGGLYTMGKNSSAQLGLGFASQGTTELGRVMEGVSRVFLFEEVGFAVKQNGELWAWGMPQSKSACPAYTPTCIAENVKEMSTLSEDLLLVLTQDGAVYTYDLLKLYETRTHSAQNLSESPIAQGVSRLYDSAWLKENGSLETVEQTPEGFSIQLAYKNALYAATASVEPEYGGQRSYLVVTSDGSLIWDGGSVSLGGLSPIWRNAALWCFAAAVLLYWWESKTGGVKPPVSLRFNKLRQFCFAFSYLGMPTICTTLRANGAPVVRVGPTNWADRPPSSKITRQ